MTTLLVLLFPAAGDAATVKVTDCVPAVDPGARTATFEARMRAARESERMQVRFALQVRDDTAQGWRRIGAAGFDTWLTSLAGVRRYSYAKTVVNLAAPAAYRTVVRFRWLDEHGEVIDSRRVTSASCRQPDMRPDLVPRRVEVLPGPDAGTRRYAVLLRNAGRTDAVPFAVTLALGANEPLTPLPVLGLAAGAQHVLTFTGPACTAGSQLTVAVDTTDAVGERDEDDNVLVTPCPAP